MYPYIAAMIISGTLSAQIEGSIDIPREVKAEIPHPSAPTLERYPSSKAHVSLLNIKVPVGNDILSCKLPCLNTYIHILHYCFQGWWNVLSCFTLFSTSLFKLSPMLRILPKHINVSTPSFAVPFTYILQSVIVLFSCTVTIMHRHFTNFSVHLQISLFIIIQFLPHSQAFAIASHFHQTALHQQQIT